MNVEVPSGKYGCPVCPDRFETVGEKRRHLREASKPWSKLHDEEPREKSSADR